MKNSKILNIVIITQAKSNYYLKKIIKIIKNNCQDKIFILRNKITKHYIKKKKINFLISFHNPFIIKKKILQNLNYNCINFHASFLPKNRGMYPILWTAYNSEQFAVTIHKINEKIDDGEYLYQKKIFVKKSCTLKKAYDIHEIELIKGFKQIIKKIRNQIIRNNRIELKCNNLKMNNSLNYLKNNSLNYLKESKLLISLLPKKWETTIKEVGLLAQSKKNKFNKSQVIFRKRN